MKLMGRCLNQYLVEKRNATFFYEVTKIQRWEGTVMHFERALVQKFLVSLLWKHAYS